MKLISRQQVKEIVVDAFLQFYPDHNLETFFTFDRIAIEFPKEEHFGDISVPVFDFSKVLKESPVKIAINIVQVLLKEYPFLSVSAISGYINFFWDRIAFIQYLLPLINENFGQSKCLSEQKIIVEFSGPNTNKPLHLGHMRNNVLGESLSRILKNAGAHVFKVNIVNDRGIHICKSMLAYKLFGKESTPESVGMKGDHFVGAYYIQYAHWEKDNPQATDLIAEMLNQWETGVPEVLDLWRTMNQWAISGITETYARTGISFDKIYYESETYKFGKNLVIQGLNDGIFFKSSDNSICLSLDEVAPENTDSDGSLSKVFLRSDGTSVYITQDLGTAVMRYEDFPFDRMIYVVAHEQKRHFEILFYALKKMNYLWSSKLHHLSYGMVNLPDGKMKSREGTVVDADDLLDSLTVQASMVANDAQRKAVHSQDNDVSFGVALGALHYFLLHINPVKDIVFDAKESLSFNGNTGPYLQYTYARIFGLLFKDESKIIMKNITIEELDLSILSTEEEWRITKTLADFPYVVEKAAIEYNPSFVATYLYGLAKLFNKFYTEVPILKESDIKKTIARLYLCQKVMIVLKNGLNLLVIPIMERM